jgi:Domain of unknown function (DUF2382)
MGLLRLNDTLRARRSRHFTKPSIDVIDNEDCTMPTNTVVGVFETQTQAQQAVNQLLSGGFTRTDIELTSDAAATTADTASFGRTTAPDETVGDRIGNFFSRLFGGERESEDVTYYSEAVRRGNAVVAVRTQDENEADKAADILRECGAFNIDEHARGLRESGWQGSRSSTTARAAADVREGDRVIPVVEEELQVGKRRRDRGGVRIYTHMSETPVQENVSLREEHVRMYMWSDVPLTGRQRRQTWRPSKRAP